MFWIICKFHVAVRVSENVSRETFERYSNTYRVETCGE